MNRQCMIQMNKENKRIKKMPICSSNLALRFYLQDGWTKEFLDSLTIKGECIYREMKFGDEDLSYYMPIPNTKLDIDKLILYVSEVNRAFDDYPNESDIEFIKRMLIF